MLELIDLDKGISKADYQQIFPQLERQLGQCQRAARQAGVPVVIVFDGWKAAGKGTVINRFTQAIDPRGFKVHPIRPPNETERLHPWLWRFWNLLPAAGEMAIFDHSWYNRVLSERVEGTTPHRQWRAAYDDVLQFERELTDAGTVIVKFWLHISKREQKRRFRGLKHDPATAWKVGKDERRQHRKFAEWQEAAEEAIQRTSTAHAPWTIVEATQERYCRVKVFQTVLDAVQSELDRRAAAPAPVRAPATADGAAALRRPTILDRVDLRLALGRQSYDEQLQELQQRLFRLEHEMYVARVPAVIAYEGWDAAGKGGNIKRLTMGLDPRGYEVVPIAAPSTEEKAHHYLWRFWRHVPKGGHITIFDRTWYGRVLVERVEGFCSESEWKRAYQEINEFERLLADSGTVVVKFWLQIDRDEQLRRFQERQQSQYKQWKITEEDWRNREKWDRYEPAVVEMLERTSTTYAPWTILESNCKLYARIKALRTVAEAVEAGLKAGRK
jgi:polyphosphate kinase 2 (PPK2 family)